MSEERLKLNEWKRRRTFERYLKADYPYINITFNLDITALHDYVHKQGISLYFSLIYLCVRSANEIENFRYRFRREENPESGEPCATPILIDKNRAFATHIQPGSDEFVIIECDDYDDMAVYAAKNRTKADLPVEDSGIPLVEGRMDNLNFSAVPWISFTHCQRPVNKKNGIDSIPKITFGKYFSSGDRLLMPISLQAHHGLMDGLHVGRFAQSLQEKLDGFEAQKGAAGDE